MHNFYLKHNNNNYCGKQQSPLLNFVAVQTLRLRFFMSIFVLRSLSCNLQYNSFNNENCIHIYSLSGVGGLIARRYGEGNLHILCLYEG